MHTYPHLKPGTRIALAGSITMFSFITALFVLPSIDLVQAHDGTPPTCNGLTATIWVNHHNVIVGGGMSMSGSAFAGTLNGGAGQDVIVGTAGNDTINGGNQSDTICGGDGDDILNGENGTDSLFGEGGNDKLLAGNGGDTMSGGPGDDFCDQQNGPGLTGCEAVAGQGFIRITKDAIPDDPQNFSFTGSFKVFQLDDDADPTLLNSTGSAKTAAAAPTGTNYTIIEAAVAGWTLTGLSCNDTGDASTTVNLGTRTATVNLDTGDIITCTFTNTQDPASSASSSVASSDVSSSVASSSVSSVPVCGNGVQEGGEACDDGNTLNGDYCNATCTQITGACGDGQQQSNEACDDGNTINGDYCSSTCQQITGSCGDSIRQSNETCDDGNTASNDGCSSVCSVENGYTCNTATPNVCTTTCGDGIPAGTEQCDDGNQSNTDGCLNSCQNAVCGDGFTRTGVEECDDGNQVNNDACSNSCTLNGQLKVVKAANGGDDLFGFSGANIVSFQLQTSHGSASTILTLAPGIYSVQETSLPAGWVMDSNTCTNVQVVGGQMATCTVTNTKKPLLTVTKVVTNDNGGTKVIADFPLFVDGNPVVSGVATEQSIGAHTVSETQSTGYTATFSGDCNGSGSVVLAAGDVKTCTITNNDQAGSITVQKTVTNDNGGTKVIADFALFVDGNPVTHNVAMTVNAGSYTVTETNLPGYAASAWGGDCSASGVVVVGLGESKTCTITNNDVQPQLIVNKVVTNDDGGTKVIADFPLFVDGNSVTSGASNGFDAGSHTVSETQSVGYTATFSGDCNGSGSVVLTVGDPTKTCTITNNDIAPKLTVTKVVVNDNGGTKVVADFALFVDGNSVTSGVENILMAGPHTATETMVFGYAPSAWSGDCTASGSITLSVGDVKSCTITNNDIQPKLTVIKTVINNDGGVLSVPDFALSVDTGAVVSGVQNGFHAGSHTVSEVPRVGYTGTIGGDCAANGSITLSVGEVKTCTIVNDDIAPVCNEQLATIWVKNGKIVGGPFNGQTYTGELDGGSGDDVIVGTNKKDKMDGKGGNDVLCGREQNDDMQGGTGNDKLWGEQGSDDMRGGPGTDEMSGGEGEDEMDGGTGEDVVKGDNGKDEIEGGSSSDILCGGNGNDEIKGGPDDDMIDAGNGSDKIKGDTGSDVCRNGENLSSCEDTTTPVPACAAV